jgi:hypothetical protein
VDGGLGNVCLRWRYLHFVYELSSKAWDQETLLPIRYKERKRRGFKPLTVCHDPSTLHTGQTRRATLYLLADVSSTSAPTSPQRSSRNHYAHLWQQSSLSLTFLAYRPRKHAVGAQNPFPQNFCTLSYFFSYSVEVEVVFKSV